MTQLYLFIVFLNPTEKQPGINQGPLIIHYYHAQNIILGKNTISDLLSIMSTLKETEYKCLMVPILFKAFQEHFKDVPDKSNIFDQVTPLF